MNFFSCFACILEFPIKFGAFCIYTQQVKSIFTPHRRSEKRVQRQIRVKCGPNFLNTLDLPGWGGGGVGVRV